MDFWIYLDVLLHSKFNFFGENHQFEDLGSILTWLEVWKSLKKKTYQKCVFVKDSNLLKKKIVTSSIKCHVTLRSAYIFLTRNGKSGHEIYFQFLKNI